VHKIIMLTAGLGAALGAGLVTWRRDPRIGSAWVNRTVNPWLLERGLAGGKHSEIGPLEHVGRRSGLVRLTPVHPEPTATGFRIVVPLGARSEWARNVLAAGRCRIGLHEQVYELASPRLVSPAVLDDLPPAMRACMVALGFRYLLLETIAVMPGRLEANESPTEPAWPVGAAVIPSTSA
jgi:deazaflavin-dependent oxidoreductase (nitroreductase family)